MLTHSDMIAHCTILDPALLFSPWSPVVPLDVEIVEITALGSAILRDSRGQIIYFDPDGTELEIIASNNAQFQARLIDPKFYNELYFPQLVSDLLKAGLNRPPEKCFSLLVPYMLGGKYELDNYHVCDVNLHFSMLGSIYSQTKN